MEAIAKSFIINISTITISLTYSYYISSNLPKGVYRFISLIPIIFIFTILPLHCSYVFTTAIVFSFTTWLTNFKLIRFAFDLAHSPYHPSYSLLKFIIISSLPIKSSSTTTNPSTSNSTAYSVKPANLKYLKSTGTNSSTSTFNPVKPVDFKYSKSNSTDLSTSTAIKSADFKYSKLGFQILIFAILVQLVRFRLNEKFVLVIYCGLLFLIIDIIIGIINTILLTLTGLELESSSNKPYFSTSLQNFWTRWNLMVTSTLRHTVYKPILSTLSKYKWAPLAAILGSFFVSGLMHELFVYHLTREKPTWEMTLFFGLHGICVVVEMIVKRAVGCGRWRLPEFLATVLTVGFVAVTGFWLFFPPLIRNGLDVKIFQEYMSVVEFIKEIFFVSQ